MQGLRADAHANVLANALRIWNQNLLAPPRDMEAYVAQALEGKFETQDTEFYAMRPALINVLEEALASDLGAFFDFD